MMIYNLNNLYSIIDKELKSIYKDILNYDTFCDNSTTLFYPELFMAENKYLCHLRRNTKWLLKNYITKKNWLNKFIKVIKYYEYLKKEIEPQYSFEDIKYEDFKWHYSNIENYKIQNTKYIVLIKYIELFILLSKNKNLTLILFTEIYKQTGKTKEVLKNKFKNIWQILNKKIKV